MANDQPTDRPRVVEWLTNNPKLLGALWALTLLLAEVAPVLADGGSSGSGP